MSNLKDLSKKAWSATSWADKTFAGVQGLSGIVGAFGDASKIKDTSNYQNEIDSLANTQFDYGDYDSLMGAYNPVSIDRLHVKDLRASNGERAIGTLKGIGSGAMAGAQIAGPIGAIVGGAAGLLSGGIGMIVGNRNAAIEARKLNQEAEEAQNRYMANFANNAQNISQNKFNAAALNLAAFGGFLKDRNMDNFTKSKVRLAAFGGDLTSTIEEPNGFSNGVIKVDEGKTHETNPFGGVLMGVDPQGTPNLVEQGEVIFNDYVFSDRLYPTGGQLESVKLPNRYEGKSYADIAFDIQRESEIRPLDSISRNSLIDSMAKLTTIQEESRERDLEYQAFDELENAFADGGSIHIKPSKRGTFTAAAKKYGMGVQEFASKVLANKDSYSPAMVKKANFARNASKWHAFGGNLFPDGGEINIDKPWITAMRAIPVMGSSLQAMSDALGWTNEEDYENPTLIRKAADRIRNVRTSPIGRYMAYNPYDVDYEMNRIQNVGLGTQRGLLDTAGGNALAARNAMIALNNNITSQMGDARRSASQVNEQRRQAVQQFNSGIDQFNAQQVLNAGIYNQRADEAKLDAAVREAMLRDNIQSTLSGARSTNYTAALNNWGQFGNDRMFADMAAWYQKYVAPFNMATQTYGASIEAKGGKIKKVKGFKIK